MAKTKQPARKRTKRSGLAPAHRADIERLARDLSAVLTNPALPRAAYDEFKRALGPLEEPDAISNTAEHLAVVFAYHAGQKGGTR